ncbi:MAG: outer membrane beta-barrel protein [Granulosicoccaceae bacterium]
MTKKTNRPISIALLALCAAMPAAAVERNPYFGLGVGVSRLSPDVSTSSFTLEKNTSTTVSVMLGLSLTQRFNAELGYSQLGNAELSDNEDISYSAFSLGAVAYVLGNAARLSHQPGLRAYVRLGLNLMDNDTDVRLTQADSTAVWLGAGLEWPLATRLSIRGEFASFDGDAQALTVALLFQPGARQPRTSVVTPVITPEQANKPSGTPTPQIVPQPTIEPTPTLEPQPQLHPEPQIQSLPAPASVPMPEPAPTLAPVPKSGVLGGVEFENGTAMLTSIGKNVLSRLAASLQEYPGLNIEIGAHTDGAKGDANKLALTRGRAIAVARHLALNGVPVRRMKARAFGANVPRASGDSPGARRLNNRVEVTIR